MKVVVAGRVCISVEVVLPADAACDPVAGGWLGCPPVVWAAAPDATASVMAAAITTRFHIRTASVTDRPDVRPALLRASRAYSPTVGEDGDEGMPGGSIRRPRPPRLICPPLRP